MRACQPLPAAAECRRATQQREDRPAAHPETARLLPRPPPAPAVLSDAVPLVLSRQLLLAFAQSLQQLQPEVQQAVAT